MGPRTERSPADEPVFTLNRLLTTQWEETAFRNVRGLLMARSKGSEEKLPRGFASPHAPTRAPADHRPRKS